MFKDKNINCLSQLTSDKGQVKQYFFSFTTRICSLQDTVMNQPDKVSEKYSHLTHDTKYRLITSIRQLRNFKHNSVKVVHLSGKDTDHPSWPHLKKQDCSKRRSKAVWLVRRVCVELWAQQNKIAKTRSSLPRGLSVPPGFRFGNPEIHLFCTPPHICPVCSQAQSLVMVNSSF